MNYESISEMSQSSDTHVLNQGSYSANYAEFPDVSPYYHPLDEPMEGFFNHYTIVLHVSHLFELNAYNFLFKLKRGEYEVSITKEALIYFGDLGGLVDTIVKYVCHRSQSSVAEASAMKLLVARALDNNSSVNKGSITPVSKLPGIYQIVRHPINELPISIEKAIISLNDKHGWTRERIADWLETLDADLRFKNGD